MPTIIRRAGTALLGILLIWAQGCDISTDRSIAQAAVATFHSELDAAQYAAIWEDADDRVHRNSSREDYDKLIGAVHKKLGTVVNTSTVGWSVNYQNVQTPFPCSKRHNSSMAPASRPSSISCTGTLPSLRGITSTPMT